MGLSKEPQVFPSACRLLYLALSKGDGVLATGLWSAVSGAAAQSHQVDVIANNLANTDTLGFKKDTPTFKDYLSSVEREKGTVDIPRGAIKDRDLYHLDGRDQSFVIVDGTHTNFKQGGIRVTEAPLDVALDGPGFLEVSTPLGVRYTRAGSLKLAMDGRLVTADGYPVLASRPLGLAGESPQLTGQPSQGGLSTQGGVAAVSTDSAKHIHLRGRGPHLTFTSTGELYAGEELVAKLNVVEFKDVAKLRKLGEQLFENQDVTNISSGPLRTIVRQGMVETSNVNPIEEMTNLIKANRLFEHDLKAVKTYGELLGREANDIGKL